MSAQLRQIKGKPGLFQVRTTKGPQVIKLVEWAESFVYDTIEYNNTGAPVPLGDQRQFFVNLQNKQRVDTNMNTPRRLQSGQELILNQIGIMGCMGSVTNTQAVTADLAWLYERVHYEFRVNNITVAEGPCLCFPPGMGVTGTDNVGGCITNGIASPAAVPRLLVPQTITENNDIQGLLTHSAAAWSTYAPPTHTTTLYVRNLLRGYNKTAVGKG